MRRKMARGLLYLGMAFILLTGCGNNNGNMYGTADMASGNGVSLPGMQAVQEPEAIQTVRKPEAIQTVQKPAAMQAYR